MQNISITVSGLEGLVAAMDKLAGAIASQQAVVVPEGTRPAHPDFVPVDEVLPKKEPEVAQVAKGKAKTKTKADTVSAEAVRKKFVDLARGGKRDELKAVLSDYGVGNVSSLPEEVLGDVYAKLEAM